MIFKSIKPAIRQEWIFNDEALVWMEANKGLSSYDEFLLSGKINAQWIHQLKCKLKAKAKIPSFYANPQLLYPPSLNLEQSSSEMTAVFKSKLFSGRRLLDLTCGFGVDSFFFSEVFHEVVGIERNQTLGELVSHNFAILGKSNVEFVIGVDSIEFLKQNKNPFDVIYIDPARRDEVGAKVIRFSDCEPNLIEQIDLLFQHTNRILIKASPFLDIQAAIIDLKHVKAVYIVSVENECKELLFSLEKQYEGHATIQAVNLGKAQEPTITFTNQEEKFAEVAYHQPMKYILEPNASILKAGAFKTVAKEYNLFKLHQNTHLYTTMNNIEVFPGRKFLLQAMCKVDKRELKKILPTSQANLSIRNFPSHVADLKKKLALKDGGEHFIIATTLADESKVLLVLSKV